MENSAAFLLFYFIEMKMLENVSVLVTPHILSGLLHFNKNTYSI